MDGIPDEKDPDLLKKPGSGENLYSASSQIITMESASNAKKDNTTSATHSDSLLNNLNMDPFNEDEAELRFLHSKPTCFLMLGKPGAGKTTLARRIAQEWKCEMINTTDLLMQNMEQRTEMGQKCIEMSSRGEAIPEEMVIKMLEDKINSAEVAHHGYILDDFPCLSEDTLSMKNQLELVKNFKLKPDFIINLKIPDKDLEKRRNGQKIDPLTGDIFIKDVYDPPKKPVEPPKDSDEEGEEEEEDVEEEESQIEDEDSIGELSTEVLERLVRRPEDLPTQTDASIKKYKSNMLRILEDYMADHDQQYLVEMDANQPISVLFKQILQRLSCFVLRPAAVPIRLHDPEDEELPEDVETDELMRSLAPKQMVAPRFRWRRSRWLRNCPVALYEGNVVAGKPEFAVAFLDKIYCLSSAEALEKFMKNPRPYMLPPQPRPPCKISVFGPPLSGKSTLCHQLAQKYGAKVLNMDELVKPRMAEEKEKFLKQTKEEVTEQAIQTVKTKLKEKMDAETAAREEAEAAALAEHTDRDDTEEEEPVEGADATELSKPAEGDTEDANAEDKTEEPGEEKPEGKADNEEESINKDQDEERLKSEEPETKSEPTVTFEEPKEDKPEEIVVDETHPEVIAIVEAAIAEAEKQQITLSPEAHIDIMYESINELEKEMRANKKDGPINGGWIFDNFPKSRDEWNVCIEKNILPDEVIIMRDTSENGDYLLRRWYNLNKEEIDTKIKVRLEAEELERKRMAEEKLKREEEERKAEEAAAKAAAEEERKRRIEAGEEIPEEDEDNRSQEGEDNTSGADVTRATEETEPKPVTEPKSEIFADEPAAIDTLDPAEPEPTDPNDSTQPPEDGDDNKQDAKSEEAVTEESVEEGSTTRETEEEKLPEGPEMEEFKETLKNHEKDWPTIQGSITGSTSIEPVILDLDTKDSEELFAEATRNIERQYIYQGWEYSGMDIEEEEEDAEAADAAEEEPEEDVGEEEEDANRNKKKTLGDTNHFCPVVLKESGVLFPGNPETCAKYREKSYYFSTNEAREKFLLNPNEFLPQNETFGAPPLRLIVLGPKGAGKTVNGRKLAQKYKLFHIQFKERLQELIIAKTKRNIGPEYEEDQEEEDEEEEDEDDEAAITSPDGSVVKDAETKDTETKQKDTDKQDEAGEEEAEVELTEEEEAIKANLEAEEPLPPEVLDNILPQWWNKEPFRSTGFILEGFPRTAEEARYMAEMGLFPDAALIINVEDTDVVGRLLPPRLDKWRVKRDKRVAKKERIKEKKKKKRDAAIQKKREELQKEAEEKKKERMAERQAMRDEADSEEEFEEEEEEEEEDDIEAALAEEFEEEDEEEEEEEEQEDDAGDRLRNDINEIYDNDMNRLAAVQETLEELLVPRVEIDGGRKPHIVKYQITKKLKPFTDFRHSIFERVYPISEKLSRRMLQSGYKQSSRFGRWCPVQLSEGDCIQPMSGPGYPTYPCIYRQYIYFLSSYQAREQFTQDPMTYLKQASPRPVVPIKLAIIGPPKSGKTTLANRFVEEYGLLRLSIGEAMRHVLQNQPSTELAEKMNTCLFKGQTVSDDLAVQALEVLMLDMRCQTRGYVLDGFPNTKKQVELMTERNILPVRVIELKIDGKEVVKRAANDRVAPTRTHPIHDSSQITVVKLASFTKHIQSLRQFYEEEHMNYIEVDGMRSKWWVWNRALDIAKSSVIQIQTYLQKISDGCAASIADMCITPKEFLERVGDFGQYCPVSLAERGELVDCSTNPTLNFAAEYRGYYYKMAGREELQQFLTEPDQFVPPLAPNKLPAPDMLPRRKSKKDLNESQEIELQSYCPVTYFDGLCRYEAIRPGNSELVVEYRNKNYNFVSEEELLKFMKLPEKYWNLKLPHKLPPKQDPINPTILPMLGYMEQTVATSLIKALTSCGNFKPKYPFLSSSRSSLLYVAYHLKAFNPKSSEYVRKKYKQKLQRFEDTCTLIQYLGDNMTVRYKDPSDRPGDFDTKLETFFALRGIEPTPTWIS